jgi:hypothetical protein
VVVRDELSLFGLSAETTVDEPETTGTAAVSTDEAVGASAGVRVGIESSCCRLGGGGTDVVVGYGGDNG